MVLSRIVRDKLFIIVANKQGYDQYVDETKATAAFQDADTSHCGKTFPVALLTEARKVTWHTVHTT